MKYILPNKYTFMFAALWLGYMALELILGNSVLYWSNLLVLLFLYFCGCLIQWLGRGRYRSPRLYQLGLLAAALVTADQLIKLTVHSLLSENQVVPVVPGLVNIARVHNLSASWLAQKFQWNFFSLGLLMALSLLMLLAVVAVYRYYRGHHQQESIWADAGALLISAGVASALLDQSLRGYTVDFINLHGLFTADLKDICLTTGMGAILAETFRSPVPDVPLKKIPALLINIIRYNLGRH